MSYAGNPSISPEVRQRILGTFDQTLQLAGEGSRQEALLGCDFVLRMDPQFEPARLLQERLKASTGPVRVDDLRGGPPPPLDDPFGDLAGLDSLGLPNLPDLPGALGGGGGAGLRSELQALLDQRRNQELMATAQREQAAVRADPELQRIVGEAQERMEAEPYVQKFLASARQALQSGQAAEAGRLLDKVRALDPGHPGLAELEAARAAAAPAPSLPQPVQFPASLQTPVLPPSFDLAGMGGLGVGDSESQRRIRELLDEGQAALDRGDPQGAIDAWSRIFLIDIDNQEAARRIEAARRLKAENERQVEEVFHEGVSCLEAGDAAAARLSFERVLQLQPGHFAAREYLQQIASGAVSSPKPGGLRDVPVIPPEPPLPLPSDLDLADSLREEILVPPDPSEGVGGKGADKRGSRTAAASRPGGRASGEGRARRLFLLVGGAVLVLALAGAWLLLQNRDRLFPNSSPETEEGASPAQPSQGPIERATRLQKAGKTAMAVAQLKRIPSNDPQHAEAQRLIAEWEGRTSPEPVAAAVPAVEGTEAPPAPPVPAAASENALRRQELLAAARQAYGERTYLRAFRRLQQAAALGALQGEDAQLLEDTKRRLAPIAQEIDLFRQHEWEFVIPRLWRLREENPADRDVTQLIVDSYYNLGVRDLQRADASKAAENFQEALNLQPDDPALRRHLQFAQTYEERPKDLLYRIYVKYLPFR